MAIPSEKSKVMKDYLDMISKKTYGRSRTESILNDICLDCGKEAKEFKDEISKEEYIISGFCQKCQDKIFGENDVEYLHSLHNMRIKK